MTQEAGQALVIPPAAAAAGAQPELLDPDGEPVLLERRVRQDGTATWQSAPLEKVGIYRLSGAGLGMGGTPVPVAVNFPASESDVRPLNETAVRAALGGIELAYLRDELPSTGLLAEMDRPDFGWSLLLVVLGLAGFEAFLAMRFGHVGRQVDRS